MNQFKSISIIISVILVIACICPVMSVGAADGLTVSASSAEGERGDTVEIALTVTNNPGFAALRITVPHVEGFELVSVKNGSVMSTMTQGVNILWDSAQNSTEVGTLVILTFQIGENAPAGDNTFDIIVRECYNEDLRSVDVKISSLKISVLGDPLVSETTEAPTEAPTELSSETQVETESETETGSKVTAENSENVTEDKGLTEQEGTVNEPNERPLIGCIGEIGVGAIIVISIIGTAFFFKKKQ